jgi:hypothetical protein
MRTPILCLKIRQMRAKLGGDAVQHEKSRAVMIGNVCRAIAGGRGFSANCFTPPFERERRLVYKSFICVRHGVMKCTLFVAVRLLSDRARPFPALPSSWLRLRASNRVSSLNFLWSCKLLTIKYLGLRAWLSYVFSRVAE